MRAIGFSASIFVPAISLGRGRRFAQISADKSRNQRLSAFICVLFHATVGKGGRNEDHRRFLDQHQIYEGSGEFRKYEVHVEFSNGDKVQAFLDAKARVKDFLEFVSRQ
ncbi:MAG TPA: hypothetical protein VII92_20915 [Anaerolineae bacterium]